MTTPNQSERVRVIREGVASYLPDIDADETSEWLESFDGLLARSGPARARYLMLRLLERLKPLCDAQGARLGLAPHSLRAVPPAALREVLAGLGYADPYA